MTRYTLAAAAVTAAAAFATGCQQNADTARTTASADRPRMETRTAEPARAVAPPANIQGRAFVATQRTQATYNPVASPRSLTTLPEGTVVYIDTNAIADANGWTPARTADGGRDIYVKAGEFRLQGAR